ncbi:hypothetical protein ACFQ9X_14185 [Catenulispora yoronensis]
MLDDDLGGRLDAGLADPDLRVAQGVLELLLGDAELRGDLGPVDRLLRGLALVAPLLLSFPFPVSLPLTTTTLILPAVGPGFPATPAPVSAASAIPAVELPSATTSAATGSALLRSVMSCPFGNGSVLTWITESPGLLGER